MKLSGQTFSFFNNKLHINFEKIRNCIQMVYEPKKSILHRKFSLYTRMTPGQKLQRKTTKIDKNSQIWYKTFVEHSSVLRRCRPRNVLECHRKITYSRRNNVNMRYKNRHFCFLYVCVQAIFCVTTHLFPIQIIPQISHYNIFEGN